MFMILRLVVTDEKRSVSTLQFKPIRIKNMCEIESVSVVFLMKSHFVLQNKR